MVPDRIIKESSCTSDTLNMLSDFEERFWWRLTVNCDDYGRFDARPAVLKSRLFPLMDGKTHKNMMDALRKLASVGLVRVYEVDGKSFLQVVNWDKHQRIRAKRSKYPSPDDGICCQVPSSDSECRRNPIQSESNPNPNPNPIQTRANSADGFEDFWAAYPRKAGKESARKAFAKVKVPLGVLLQALEKQKQSQQWLKDNGQFIPYPATWLNQGRWEDEVPQVGSRSSGQGGKRELDTEELEALQRLMAEDCES